ncbi:MAG: amidohydrolase [Chloroflexota bacterium]|nr:amidohydrolase [Chloroflexota bacterium]
MDPITLTLRNGHVLTMDPDRPRAEAVAVSGARFVAVGSDAEIAAMQTAHTREIDMAGGMLVPGFIDSHLHLIEGGRTLIELRLRYCNSPAALEEQLRAAAAEKAPGEWIIGQGWDDPVLTPGQPPHRTTLDAIVPDHPVVLVRRDGHSAWLNSAAVEATQVARFTSISAEEIPRDADGTSTGMLYEQGATQVLTRLRLKLPRAYVERAAREALAQFVRAGLTMVHDVITGDPRDFWLFRRLLRAGDLPLRIIASPYGTYRLSRMSFRPLSFFDSPMLRVGPDKYLLDGSFGSSTALLGEPYADDPGGTNIGLQTLSSARLERIFERTLRQRRPVVVHAIGDRAVEVAVMAMEKALARYGDHDVRNRVEHVQIVDPAIIPRFKAAGLIASFQPNFLYENEMTRRRLGQARSERCYPCRDFWDAGVPVILSSDWAFGGGRFPLRPDGTRYESFEPLLGIHAAVDRVDFDPAQALTVEQALVAYTRNAAWAHYREAELGTITPGKLADFALLSQDITAIPTAAILETQVQMTGVGGQIVFAA